MGKILSTDSEWEKFGRTNPYFGVCSDNAFKTKNLTTDSLQAFFESGKDHVQHVLDTLSWVAKKPITKLKSVLDFGCGTGRLLIPLASISETARGIDVSKSMLTEAVNNIKRIGINNIELINSNSLAEIKSRKFDLIHTYIVLQHVPTAAGYDIIRSLVQVIDEGGLGMIHFTYRNDKNALQNIGRILKSRSPVIAKISNLIKNRSGATPHMQMNNYNLKKVFKIFEEEGIDNCYAEFTNHGGFHGICLYCQKIKV